MGLPGRSLVARVLGEGVLRLEGRDEISRVIGRFRGLAAKSSRLTKALEPLRREVREAKRMAANEAVLACWRPSADLPIDYIHWMLTEWCNYRCPYCPQDHARGAPKGTFTAHAFDNHPLERWLGAFARHYRGRRLSLKLTGGEPMLDKSNMVPLLETLTAMPTVVAIRIDTNASFSPEPYKKIDHGKVRLMCTFHPSQVDEETFFSRLDRLCDAGFRIGMVNYVIAGESARRYQAIGERLAKLGIPLHPNPLWDSGGQYRPEDLRLFESELPRLDFGHRTQLRSPAGQRCLHPMVAYMLDQTGRIGVACFSERSGSFFGDEPPTLFSQPVACPSAKCVCLDMYSFLEGVDRNRGPDPLAGYSRLLLKRRLAKGVSVR